MTSNALAVGAAVVKKIIEGREEIADLKIAEKGHFAELKAMGIDVAAVRKALAEVDKYRADPVKYHETRDLVEGYATSLVGTDITAIPVDVDDMEET